MNGGEGFGAEKTMGCRPWSKFYCIGSATRKWAVVDEKMSGKFAITFFNFSDLFGRKSVLENHLARAYLIEN